MIVNLGHKKIVKVLWYLKLILYFTTSAVDPNTLNLDPDTEFLPILDPDPRIERKNLK